eukprot:5584174-Amphidinium_carterae.1
MQLAACIFGIKPIRSKRAHNCHCSGRVTRRNLARGASSHHQHDYSTKRLIAYHRVLVSPFDKFLVAWGSFVPDLAEHGVVKSALSPDGGLPIS